MNDLYCNILQTLVFSEVVEVVYRWMLTQNDTLLIITADHETGGLEVAASNGTGELPQVTWKTLGHTGVDVPVCAVGISSVDFRKQLKNTDVSEFVIY